MADEKVGADDDGFPGVLKLGSPHRKAIARVQRRLAELGCRDNLGRELVASGVFDKSTEEAVIRFQKSYPDRHGKKLEVTGTIQFEHWDTMFDEAATGMATFEADPPADLPPLPAITGSTGNAGLISDRAFALILRFEGFDQPGKWPGEESGITLGHGYDLGYRTTAQFRRDWEKYLKPAVLDRLSQAIGVRGLHARALAPSFSDILIRKGDGLEVFTQRTLPEFFARTLKAMPGLQALPFDAQGALVSLVYNRGDSMKDTDRRKEMRAVRDAVGRGDLRSIVNSIREMKRLWPNTRGLRLRRDAEADLVESAIPRN